jgi:hypothetical protein
VQYFLSDNVQEPKAIEQPVISMLDLMVAIPRNHKRDIVVCNQRASTCACVRVARSSPMRMPSIDHIGRPIAHADQGHSNSIAIESVAFVSTVGVQKLQPLAVGFEYADGTHSRVRVRSNATALWYSHWSFAFTRLGAAASTTSETNGSRVFQHHQQVSEVCERYESESKFDRLIVSRSRSLSHLTSHISHLTSAHVSDTRNSPRK